jgi:uncharacterized protein YfiM (DUF2279 family)
MNDKKLYEQKKQAQLDQWQAEVDMLKAEASEADADAKLKMNQKINSLETKIEEGKMKLSQLAGATDEAWDSIKDGVETAWDSLKHAFSDAASKFKEEK